MSRTPRGRRSNINIEDLINRINQLEVTVEEVQRENQELRQEVRRLGAQEARQREARELRQIGAIRHANTGAMQEIRVLSERDLEPGNAVRTLNSDNPREQLGTVTRVSNDRVHFIFNGSRRPTWRMHSNVVRVDRID